MTKRNGPRRRFEIDPSQLDDMYQVISTQQTAKYFVLNATTLGIMEKSGELLERPFGKISSQAPHVTERPGVVKVQRLGGEDNDNPPTSARRESDDIVWAAWQHAEIGDKHASDNKPIISQISPIETPFITMAKRSKATAVLTEWQTDALLAAAGNKQIEGDDASGGTSNPTSRLGMYCQISSKYAVISDTQQAVDKAGRANEMSYQIAKRLGELKRDQEFAFLNHQGSSAGSATVARSTASVESWLTTPTGASMVGNSTDIGTGGNYTTPGWTSGGSILAPTDSSLNGTLTVANLKAVISSCWDAGGMPGIIMCGSSLKQGISAFAGIATLYREAGTTSKGTAIVGAADLYISDFGEHRVVPNRFCKSNQVLVLDMDYWSVAYLRPVRQIEIARTGAADRRFIDVEYALVANNPQSSGKISSAVKNT